MAKTSIIDYVIVHELCHMVHKKHLKEYWNILRTLTLMSDYERRKEWLRVKGKMLEM